MGKGIVVDGAPVATDKGTDQQQESALRLMEVGDEHLYDFILVTRNDDDLRGRMKRRQMMAVEPVQQRTKGGRCLSWEFFASEALRGYLRRFALQASKARTIDGG